MVLFLAFLVYLGVFFWVYLYMRMRLESLAKGKYYGRPVMLFLMGMGGFFVTVLALWLVVLMGRALNNYSFLLFMLALGGSGSLGWVIYFYRKFRDRKLRKAFDESHPVPKLQLWMQDMFAPAVFFATYMGFYLSWGRTGSDPQQVFVLAAYAILCTAVGLFFALDVCRRSMKLQRPIPRLLFISGVLVYTTFFFIVPTWMTWRAWLYALWKSDQNLGLDMLQHQRQATDRAVDAIIARAGDGSPPA
ncbi:MAG: hypothetical protein KIS92_08645 [Planctomycetota bacterium]|nr:hypothetical protein [Planctomycetota bacterium]